MDRRAGRIEWSLGTLLWSRTGRHALDEFSAVGIGMAGGRRLSYGPRARYLVQLIGRTSLNLPGTSSDREAIVSLAEEVGRYLSLPVDRTPRVVF